MVTIYKGKLQLIFTHSKTLFSLQGEYPFQLSNCSLNESGLIGYQELALLGGLALLE